MNIQDGKKSPLNLFAASFIPSLKLLRKNDPLRLAGATAFFTTFALPPIVFILAQLFGLLTAPKKIGRGLISNLGNSLGEEGAKQIRDVILSIRGFSNSWYVIIPGFIFLIFVSTTLFSVIRSSLEQIWEIKERKSSIASSLGSRLKSFAVILLIGILFFAELFLRSLETTGGAYIQKTFGGGSVYFKIIFSEITAAVIISTWFILLFRFLTHVRPHWSASVIGGLLTGIFFTAGRFLLRTLLLKGNVGVLYGASGSLVLVLLFVFYTSFILYFGACFIRIYSGKNNYLL
jgi:membrane protein